VNLADRNVFEKEQKSETRKGQKKSRATRKAERTQGKNSKKDTPKENSDMLSNQNWGGKVSE